uniref:VWFA domain-containing protein n=1 Tax=Chelydra serpentina TaxID=8475 RepID=A0A8C3XMA4_CHESE
EKGALTACERGPNTSPRLPNPSILQTAPTIYPPTSLFPHLPMDSSGSIGQENFLKMKTFMRELVNKSDISADRVQVGVVQFSGTTNEEFQLDRYSSKSDIFSAIDRMSLIGENTLTGGALTFVADYFKPPKGARPAVKKFLILITDGEAQDEVKVPAKALRDQGVVIYSVGVFNANKPQLQEISGKPELVFYVEEFDILKHDKYYYVDTFEGLKTTSIAISEKIYDDSKPGKGGQTFWPEGRSGFLKLYGGLVRGGGRGLAPTCYLPPSPRTPAPSNPFCREASVADIVFLVDGSWSIGNENFRRIQDFLYIMVSGFDVGEDKIRIGLIQYSDAPHTEFFLSTYNDKEAILKKIQTLRYKGGGTKTGESLRFMLENHFKETVGSRREEGVPQIAVVITDGKAQDNIQEPAKEVKDAGITLYAIGIKGASLEELQEIASDPYDKHVYEVEDFTDLQDISHNMLQALCRTVEEVNQIAHFSQGMSTSPCISVYVVGINVQNSTKLQEIANKPLNKFLFSIGSYDVLQDLPRSLLQTMCFAVESQIKGK